MGHDVEHDDDDMMMVTVMRVRAFGSSATDPANANMAAELWLLQTAVPRGSEQEHVMKIVGHRVSQLRCGSVPPLLQTKVWVSTASWKQVRSGEVQRANMQIVTKRGAFRREVSDETRKEKQVIVSTKTEDSVAEMGRVMNLQDGDSASTMQASLTGQLDDWPMESSRLQHHGGSGAGARGQTRSLAGHAGLVKGPERREEGRAERCRQ